MDGTTSERRMRSGAVALGLVGSLAMALTSCGGEPDQRCVDSTTYKTVANQLCTSSKGGGYADGSRYQWYQQGGNSTYVSGYHRYYGSGGSRLTTGRGSTGGEDGGGDGGGEGITRGGLGGHSGSGHGG